MAGYPPPYPPPSGSPFGFDPKQQARMARDQARFAREQYKAQARAAVSAARAQRDLYRYQNRGYRRSSILGPLIVLAVGIVILLIRLGRIPMSDFGVWYGRWWPALLVLAGIILVAEWAFDQAMAHNHPDGPPYVRRGIGGGAILLLIFLTCSGAVVHHIHTYHQDFLNNLAIDPGSIDEFFGEKHETSASADAPFAVGTTLEINNPHGGVTIVGKSDDNKVHININKQVYSSSDSDANSKASELSPRISQSGSVLTVSIPWVRGATTDLDITVPDFGETNVTANQGDVAVSGMHAPVTITANHGDVELNSITGAVAARVNHRDATVTAHNITGDLSVRGHADDMTVTDVSGQTSFEGEFYGDTHLERLHGPVSFHTSRTQLNLVRLDGQLNISPDSDLTGDQITGPTTLKTRSRNINLDRVAGDVDVTNSNGSVDITAAPPLGGVSVDNKSGEINLTVPEHSGFTIDADTRDGQIEDDFNLHPTTNNNRSSVSGTVGKGGPRIVLHTTHLDINLHEKPVAPLPPPTPPAAPKPPAPAPPKPPAAPSKTT